MRRIAAAALVSALALITWQILEAGPPDTTTLGLLLVAIVALAALVDPVPFQRLSERVTTFEGFGVKVGLEIQRAERVDARFPEADDGVKIKARKRDPDDPAREMEAVVRKLRSRLRFLVIAVLGERDLVIEPRPEMPDLITEQPLIARLESVGLLERDEAQLSHELLGELRDQLPDWEAADREKFLDNAWNFASRLTTGVFDRHARKQFKEHGWFVGEFDQPKDHRPEFIVHKQERWACVAARVGDPAKSKSLTKMLRRLSSDERAAQLPRPVVVLPDHVDGLRKELDEDVVALEKGKVLAARLGNLLENPERLDPGRAVPEVKNLAPDDGRGDKRDPPIEADVGD